MELTHYSNFTNFNKNEKQCIIILQKILFYRKFSLSTYIISITPIPILYTYILYIPSFKLYYIKKCHC